MSDVFFDSFEFKYILNDVYNDGKQKKKILRIHHQSNNQLSFGNYVIRGSR